MQYLIRILKIEVMLFNHSVWSWNKNLFVLLNMPVVKSLSVGENPTANMCVKHRTQGKLLISICVGFSKAWRKSSWSVWTCSIFSFFTCNTAATTSPAAAKEEEEEAK